MIRGKRKKIFDSINKLRYDFGGNLGYPITGQRFPDLVNRSAIIFAILQRCTARFLPKDSAEIIWIATSY